MRRCFSRYVTLLPSKSIEAIEVAAEKYLVGQFKLVYLKGKGKKCVPVLVPNDLIDGMKIIYEHREAYGLTPKNQFLFGTKGKKSHCSGWHALKSLCEKAGVEIPINANKMRHKLSTVFASLDMSSEDKNIFWDHMGHDEEINKDNYQCPLGVKTLHVMGNFLKSVDEGPDVKASSSQFGIVQKKFTKLDYWSFPLHEKSLLGYLLQCRQDIQRLVTINRVNISYLCKPGYFQEFVPVLEKIKAANADAILIAPTVDNASMVQLAVRIDGRLSET
ncbi:hypothetical protein KUTeg_005919 [Tegillarca granosa]|uniref:Tyr recombinase domain-containing protein n=1 Tax=Tegillarca granosa TaxID=220873 RepID=A0ABQ9FKP8_TEGGR|nr:hypothetical protein KUTeg_005919 [Tegillarca granosa]